MEAGEKPDPQEGGCNCGLPQHHKTLTRIINVKDKGLRLLKCRIQLEEYNEITYKRGYQNMNADALSRIGSITAEAKGGTK